MYLQRRLLLLCCWVIIHSPAMSTRLLRHEQTHTGPSSLRISTITYKSPDSNRRRSIWSPSIAPPATFGRGSSRNEDSVVYTRLKQQFNFRTQTFKVNSDINDKHKDRLAKLLQLSAALQNTKDHREITSSDSSKNSYYRSSNRFRDIYRSGLIDAAQPPHARRDNRLLQANYMGPNISKGQMSYTEESNIAGKEYTSQIVDDAPETIVQDDTDLEPWIIKAATETHSRRSRGGAKKNGNSGWPSSYLLGGAMGRR